MSAATAQKEIVRCNLSVENRGPDLRHSVVFLQWKAFRKRELRGRFLPASFLWRATTTILMGLFLMPEVFSELMMAVHSSYCIPT